MEPPTENAADLAQRPRVINHVEAAVDRSEVLRYLGYPVGREPAAQLQSVLDGWIAEASQRAQPRATYLVLPVDSIDRHLVSVRGPQGITTFKGAIGEFLGPAKLVAAFIATAGPEVERFASQQMTAGDDFAAVAINAVGAERAEAAEAAVIAELRDQFLTQSLTTTLPYSPGYCGMALTQQRALFGLFDGQGVGVTLTEDCLMRPLKSISGLIGLGLVGEVAAHGSPCDRCELYSCAMRR